ncbi:MAG: pilus assembly protein, partial [Deltaproteobacteria bacterium]|nr:pilus assembly protein [Deltaproteobacteria bacterium]
MVKQTTKIARKRRSQAGASTVEAVIVLPVMLLLVFAIAELGIAFTRSNSLTNAVR